MGWEATGAKAGGWLVSLFRGQCTAELGITTRLADEAMNLKISLLLNNNTFLAPINRWHGNKEIQETSRTRWFNISVLLEPEVSVIK